MINIKKRSWIVDILPPLGVKVEVLLHYTPCPYYIKIGIRNQRDEKYYTDVLYRKKSKDMVSGYIWTSGVGTPSAMVEGWRPLT